MTSDGMLQAVTDALQDKKAYDLAILDLQGLTVIADYFVIATGTSAPHLRALVDAVLEAAKGQGVKGVRREGDENSGWVLLDLGDTVTHLFTDEQREFYKLERLWADATRLPLPEEPGQ